MKATAILAAILKKIKTVLAIPSLATLYGETNSPVKHLI